MKNQCFKCKGYFSMLQGFTGGEMYCKDCYEVIYPTIKSGIFLSKEDLWELQHLYKLCTSISYNLVCLNTKDPQKEYEAFMKIITKKYNITKKFSISREGEFNYPPQQ